MHSQSFYCVTKLVCNGSGASPPVCCAVRFPCCKGSRVSWLPPGNTRGSWCREPSKSLGRLRSSTPHAWYRIWSRLRHLVGRSTRTRKPKRQAHKPQQASRRGLPPPNTVNAWFNKGGATMARLLKLAHNAGLVMGSTVMLKQLLLPKMLVHMPDIICYIKALALAMHEKQ